jgi:hypothetical protein
MDTAITVFQVILTLLLGVNALSQLLVPYAKFSNWPGQAWSKEFKPWHIKLIGFVKLCAIVGMIAPLLLPSLTMLTPLAAVGLALIIAGAMATHLRREEYANVVGLLIVFLAPLLFVAYGTLVGVAV